MGALIIVGLVALVVIVFAVQGLKIIRQGETKQTLIRMSDVIDLREQVYDFPEQSVITKDNVTTSINALLYFQITDPFKSVYEIVGI